MEVKLLLLSGMILINCLAVLGYDDGDYCYSDDETPYGYFGTKTPYDNVRSTEIASPAEECWITYIWALISHGTRHVTESDGLSPQSLSDIRDEIVKNHEEFDRGELCEEDVDLLKNWKFPWDEKTFGELAAQGKVDMENLAARWRRKFPGFIHQHDKFRFRCSSAQLSRNSAKAFRDKIYGSERRIEFNDELFEIRPYINASENKELDEFTKTSFMEDILFEISTRLGYENFTLSFDVVMKLYRQCALEKANKPSAKSAFCSIFNTDHLEVMEYCDDLDTYYALGYGDSNNTNRACSLTRDLFQKLDKINLDTQPYQQGAFNFGQGYNVLTLLTKLGLFYDSKPLKHDNYESQDSRKWRTSFIDPFAANIFVVMYNCSHQLKVSFYVNEVLVHYPGCDKGICLWSSLREKFRSEMLKDCPVGESSAVKMLSVNVQSIIYTLALIFSLNSWCKFIHV